MRPFRFFSGNTPTAAQLLDALNEFAELLSLDYSLPEIADRMDTTLGSCCVFLAMLRQEYGAQAA